MDTASDRAMAREAAQQESLRRLIAEACASNPFYQRHWRVVGDPLAWTSLEEAARRLPFTDKAMLVADQAAWPPYGSNLTYSLERYTRCHGTSGTSGRPLRWLDTPESWSWMLDSWARVFSAAGVHAADRIFFAFSFGPFLGFWTAFESALRLGCLCLPGGGMTSVARLHSILDQQATVLCCTPSYALHLGEVASAHGVRLAEARVRCILVAGEPGGSVPAVRSAIQARWPRARVFDHHGMTEVGPVSYECPVEPGVLHVIESAYWAEVVSPAEGLPLPAGQVGELVLTTLGRLGSPLIRYRTGDLVRARERRGACACGTQDLALEGGVLGRADDMVVVRGVNVFPSAVDDILREVGEVVEYQAEVVREGALLGLRLVVEMAPTCSPSDVVRTVEKLERAFQTRLALRVAVRVVESGVLPRFEMKARRWVRLDLGGAAAS